MIIINKKDLAEIELKLYEAAMECRKNAYAPYSNYKVGAALLDIKNNIHTGCNIENAIFTTTTHAEMLAIDSMVKTGVLKMTKILIVLEGNDNPATPCGLCRQKMIEFADKDLEIISVNLDKKNKIKKIYRFTLGELMPYLFDSTFFIDTK